MKKINKTYWQNRMDSIYLQYVYYIARVVAPNAKSIIDVGSKQCAYLEWFDWIPRKVSIDMQLPYKSSNVLGIKNDFLDDSLFGSPYDIALCLQVLEHVEDAKKFAEKLLLMAPHLIISVPYKWDARWVETHIQDPVDEEKIKYWFDRSPNYQYIVKEPLSKARRIVCYFDRDNEDRKVTKEEIKSRRPYALL